MSRSSVGLVAVAATVFIIMYKQPKDPARTNMAIDLFKWALENGQKQPMNSTMCPTGQPREADRESLEKQFAGLKG